MGSMLIIITINLINKINPIFLYLDRKSSIIIILTSNLLKEAMALSIFKKASILSRQRIIILQ
jgi:hypothetical protein